MDRRGRGTIIRAGVLVAALAGGAAGAWALRQRAARPPQLRLVDPAGPDAKDTAAQLTPFHRAGAGSPVVLLHGITGTWRMWEPLLPHLTEHHDVLALTLLGHSGATALPDGVAASVDAVVDAVEAELDRLGLDTAHLVGNSLGGWVAIELARRGRARSLVLFSPAGAYTSRKRLALVTASISATIALLTRLAPKLESIVARPAARRALLWAQVAHPDRVSPEVALATLRAATDAGIAPALLQVLGDTPLDALPADRPYPVRLVWADPDRVIPWGPFGEPMAAKLPGAEVIRQRGIGHVPMSDDPELVSRLITEVTAAADRVATNGRVRQG